MTVTGAILAGGRSTRYGGAPKGLERVNGRRIIDRVRDALEPVVDELLLVANDPAGAKWLPGVRCEADVLRDVGSVAGIHAALVHARTPVLVVAWDMPFVPTSLLRALRDAGAGVDASVAESDSRRGVEPLCAYYAPACVKAIETRVSAGDRRVVAFYDDVRVARMGAEVVARFGDPALLFMNVNTPEERVLAEAHAAAADGGRYRQEE
ncbi:MAG TPA: molybdenum cofactor guanylyltransferase [Gemmatimonadaceae bacterium]|nr:molybdenum cofactor guanylyltransferase [Gemmatimonadaceae bacterium]